MREAGMSPSGTENEHEPKPPCAAVANETESASGVSSSGSPPGRRMTAVNTQSPFMKAKRGLYATDTDAKAGALCTSGGAGAEAAALVGFPYAYT